MMINPITTEINDYVRIGAYSFSKKEFIDIMFDVLITIEYKAFRPMWDYEIDKPDYHVVKLILLDADSIGRTNEEIINLYNFLVANPEQLKRLNIINNGIPDSKYPNKKDYTS